MFGWSVIFAVLFHSAGAVNYRQEMKSLIVELANVSRSTKPQFLIVPQNSLELLASDDDLGDSADLQFMATVSGIGREDFHFGYESDDRETPVTLRREWLGYLSLARAHGLPCLVIDHCYTPGRQLRSRKLSRTAGFLSFASNRVDFGNLSIANEHNSSVTRMDEVRNFAEVVKCNSTEELSAAAESNFDLLIVHPVVNGQYVSSKMVGRLQRKPNGSRRLLLAAISAVQLDSDHPAYQPAWLTVSPSWQESRRNDTETAGDTVMRAKFWTKDWRQLLVNKLITALVNLNFDGVYLLHADAYNYYDEND